MYLAQLANKLRSMERILYLYFARNNREMAVNKLLKMTKALVERYHEDDDTVRYTVDGKPLTWNQYDQELLDAEVEIQRGELTSVEDLEKESWNW